MHEKQVAVGKCDLIGWILTKRTANQMNHFKISLLHKGLKQLNWLARFESHLLLKSRHSSCVPRASCFTYAGFPG